MKQPDDNKIRQPLRTAIILTVLLAMALLVRLHVASRAQNIARDGTIYLHMAKQLTIDSESVIRSQDYHPAYPAIVAIAARLTGADWPDGWIACGRVVSIVMSLVALAGIFFISAALFNRTVAMVAVLLYGLSDNFTRISCDVVSDPTAVAFAVVAVGLGIWAGRKIKSGNWWAAAITACAGLAAGLGYLTRPEEVLAAGIVILLLTKKKLDRRARTIQAVSMITLVAATLVCVLPYATAIGGLTNKKGLEDFVMFGGSRYILAAVSFPLEILFALRKTLDCGENAMGHVVGFFAVVAWATWLGMYLFRLRLPREVAVRISGEAVIAMFGMTVVMLPLVTAMACQKGDDYLSMRHTMMPAIMLVPATGVGFLICVAWTLKFFDVLRWKRRIWIAVAGWLTVAIAISVIRTLPEFHEELHESKDCYRQAGLALNRQFGDCNYVLTDDNWIKFFAGAPRAQFASPTKFPYMLGPENLASPDSIIARAAAASPRPELVAITAYMVNDKKCPNKNIVTQLKTDRRFEFLGEYAHSDKHRVWLFRILSSAPEPQQ